MQIYARLLDEGIYLCSISTFYRVLEENRQVKERRRQARHPARAVPELVATGPGQVFSWDITKLAGPIKGKYYDCYVMIDIYSRYIVGAYVHAHESGELAVEMMKEIFGIHGIPQIVHADHAEENAKPRNLPAAHAPRGIGLLSSAQDLVPVAGFPSSYPHAQSQGNASDTPVKQQVGRGVARCGSGMVMPSARPRGIIVPLCSGSLFGTCIAPSAWPAS